MPSCSFMRWSRVVALALSCAASALIVKAQGAKQSVPESPVADPDADHIKERNEWFFRGRIIRGKPSAELRRRAYQAKVQMRAQQAAALTVAAHANSQSVPAPSRSGLWVPLGPMPLASDATGNGTQDYRQVSGRATAVSIDPADQTGNTIYVGGAQSGVWKSINAANSVAGSVTWSALTDDQATLSIGAIAIQPGNADPAKSVVLAATGEADNSGDSYFGLGILRSADGGNTWALIPTANGGALSFSGLGGTRMAFSSTTPNTVVSAMATTSEGVIDGAVTANTTRGLYTSVDAGKTWNYDALRDAGSATDATSATSVVYNPGAAMFFAAVRYHGFYSSPDGVTWNRLTNQPGGAVLGAAACPPQSTSNGYACPVYRAEITAVPGRNEMYAWYVSFSSGGGVVDGGIWQSLNGGASWTPIADGGIKNCGDFYGCGVQQGTYDLELSAVPNGAATDLYAGAINLYKCGINTQNLTCASSPFLNLTHVYGCDPIGAPAHVHPDQHALAYTIPVLGNALLYFANDGGIYRALDGFSGLNSGDCSGTNQFDDLNQNLGSMTQFVSFSQHPSDANTLLGGTQDNGSPATGAAITSLSWGNVLGGDGGYNAIDATLPSNFYASNPDIPPGGLSVQLCTGGVNCNDSGFNSVVASGAVGGDDGGFYFPFILDPASSSAMLIGSCRVWRGPRAGGAFTVLSPNFETLGSGTCSGGEINQVRALAAGGPTDSNGSAVVYATTGGLGPLEGPVFNPAGGRVWVTTNATAGASAFAEVTDHGPQGNINPNQFPVSGVAVDSSDTTGKTAYVTVMGFTGGTGHVWKTSNGGVAWTDFTGNLPDSPVNAVVVYSPLSQVYVATDVGVFGSSTSAPNWTELGPNLPNVAVTALGVFASGGQQLLRASTYGRGMWQFNLDSVPDFEITITDSPLSISAGGTATFTGTAKALNAYSSTVTLSCVAGATAAPSSCSSAQSPLVPGISTPFTVSASGVPDDYYFKVKGVGSDSNSTTHVAAVVLHVAGNVADFALSENGSFPTVNVGSNTTSGPISVTATSGFTGTISLSCSLVSGNGSCSVNPSSVSSIPSTPSVTVNADTLSPGSYQMIVQGSSGTATHTLLIAFNVVGDFALAITQPFPAAGVYAGSAPTAKVSVTPNYSGSINAACDASGIAGSQCTVAPGNPVTVSANAAATLFVSLNVPNSAAPAPYNINLIVSDAGSTGQPSHTVVLPLTVLADFSISSATPSQTVTAGQTTTAYNLSVQPAGASFNNAVTLSCAGIPTGAQCLFNPSSTVTPGNSSAAVAMTISTSPTTSAGTYPVSVTGTSGSLSSQVGVSLVVTSVVVVSDDFSLGVTQAFPANIDAGSASTARVSVTPNYSGSVNATCDVSSMPGAQCTVTPANPVTISSNTAVALSVLLNVPNTAAPSPYNINLTVTDAGSSGQPSHTIQLPLTVIPDFSVRSATSSQTVTAGSTSGPYQLTVAPNPQGFSFAGAVTLSCSGLPAGAKCLFNPSAPQAPGSSAVNIVMTISTTTASGSLLWPHGNRSIFYALWLLLPGMFIGFAVLDGGRGKFKVRTFGATAALFLLTLSLLSCGGVSNSGGGNGAGGTPTTSVVTITGTSGSLSHSTAVTLVVN